MYVTGACGALYDGTSPDGTCYEPDSIQKVHQSYGRPYQLPNSTAHNETCANIGNMLFNWRMLEVTGDAKYAELVETCLYNSILSGISLDGKKYQPAGEPFTARQGKWIGAKVGLFSTAPFGKDRGWVDADWFRIEK